MAGSGKTTLMKALSDHLAEAMQVPYLINSDPAVAHVPYVANIDIRDAVDYKQVMKQYGLGPNGGILTSLNLFATKFDQVLDLCTKRSQEVTHILVDTPGQIEAFTWSASGQIITEALASEFPTCVLFVVDIPRSNAPRTFMSNMLYACSILYKTRLPIVIALNKSDVESGEDQLSWMADFEEFQAALDNDTDVTYASTLTRSMSLALDEFYSGLAAVPVSAATGAGLGDLASAILAAAEEYETGYAAEMRAARAAKTAQAETDRAAGLARLKADVDGVAPAPGAAAGPHLTAADVASVGGASASSVGAGITAALESVEGGAGGTEELRETLMREAPEMGVMANGVRQPGWEPDAGEVAAAAEDAALRASLQP
jgi:GTPase SAR1 family protein